MVVRNQSVNSNEAGTEPRPRLGQIRAHRQGRTSPPPSAVRSLLSATSLTPHTLTRSSFTHAPPAISIPSSPSASEQPVIRCPPLCYGREGMAHGLRRRGALRGLASLRHLHSPPLTTFARFAFVASSTSSSGAICACFRCPHNVHVSARKAPHLVTSSHHSTRPQQNIHPC